MNHIDTIEKIYVFISDQCDVTIGIQMSFKYRFFVCLLGLFVIFTRILKVIKKLSTIDSLFQLSKEKYLYFNNFRKNICRC